MTRKDYVAVAKVIRETFEDVVSNAYLCHPSAPVSYGVGVALSEVADRLAVEVFGPDNPRFDRQKFMAAAIEDAVREFEGPLDSIVIGG